MKKKSKAERVRDHLISGKPLSKLECFKLYSYWNLSDIVYKMKKDNYNIRTSMCKTTTGSSYAEYKLIK